MPSQSVNNLKNIVSIPSGVKGSIHSKISGYYSSIQPFSDGKTVREWLRGKSFDEQLAFGTNVLKKYGKLTATENGWLFEPFKEVLN